MVGMRTALLLGCLAMLLPLAGTAEADESLGGTHGNSQPAPCERLSRPVLFLGTIRDVKQKASERYEATFTVDEVLRGKLGPTVVVHLAGDKGRCAGGSVAVGEKFLISTWESTAGVQRELTHVSCSGVWHGENAISELAYAKGAASRKTGTLEGTVAVLDAPYHNGQVQPRANVVVRVVGTGYSTRSRADGFYRFLLPPGSYELEIVPDDPGLVEARYPVYYDKQLSVSTGKCTHRYVQPGEHYIAVSVPFEINPIPSTFYPGVPTSAKARRVSVARGQLVTGIDFQHRALQPLRKITGTVKPMPVNTSLFLLITNTTEGRATGGRVYTDGAFDVQEAAGADLMIRACRSDGRWYDLSKYPANLCGPWVKLPPGSDRSVEVEGPR